MDDDDAQSMDDGEASESETATEDEDCCFSTVQPTTELTTTFFFPFCF